MAPSKFKSLRHKFNPIHQLIKLVESKPITERIILRILFFITIGGLIYIGLLINDTFVVETPVAGGKLIEGVIGIPRFVNPALAVTKADQDMTALIYAGLMKINEAGNLVPDIADTVTVSADGKTYNIIIKSGILFHDGIPLTAKDVAFTIGLIQNPDLKSPLRGNWSGVTTEIINDTELNIILDEPYTPFIENFTLGILPKHIWGELPIEQITFSQKNTEPIGSGPFFIKKIVRDDTGLITNYLLDRFSKNQTPANLDQIEIKFYQNEDSIVKAFNAKEIFSTTYLPPDFLQTIKTNPKYHIIEVPIPRVFAIFFNQNHSPSLRDIGVRQALAVAINKDDLVNTALIGFGIPISSPVPLNQNKLESESTENKIALGTTTVGEAIAILKENGWNRNTGGLWEKRINKEVVTLNVTIKTANNPLMESAVQNIANSWREIGVEVQVEQFEQTDLLQAVIRPRDFEALLFGIDVNRAIDLYPFWHSSQRADPGLNIANYANIEVDSLLQKARLTQNTEEQNQLITKATEIINSEVPAIFLFVPTMTYVVNDYITPTSITKISKQSERFMNISDWHMNTNKLWNFFR